MCAIYAWNVRCACITYVFSEIFFNKVTTQRNFGSAHIEHSINVFVVHKQRALTDRRMGKNQTKWTKCGENVQKRDLCGEKALDLSRNILVQLNVYKCTYRIWKMRHIWFEQNIWIYLRTTTYIYTTQYTLQIHRKPTYVNIYLTLRAMPTTICSCIHLYCSILLLLLLPWSRGREHMCIHTSSKTKANTSSKYAIRTLVGERR